MSALNDLRQRLKYQAAALTCSLGPKDCAQMLVLLDRHESDDRGLDRVIEEALLADVLRAMRLLRGVK